MFLFFGIAYAQNTAALSLIQTFPALPPSGRNGGYLGEEVANIGDVNGDGYDDWAFGLKDAAIYPSGLKTGKVYICFGGSSLVNEKDPDLILTGEADGDGFGISVSCAGDVNQDGFSDVIVGVPIGGGDTGRAYLFLGGASMDNIADIIFTGEAFTDLFGNSDALIGAHRNLAGGWFAGRAYLYLGGSNPDNIVAAIFTGEASFDYLGMSVSSAGDVNNDGYVVINYTRSDALGYYIAPRWG